MSPRKVKVALVGGGPLVNEAYLPAIQKLSQKFELKAIFSRTAESAVDIRSRLKDRQAAKTVEIYSDDYEDVDSDDEDIEVEGDYDDLLSEKEVEAVIIAVPIPSQPAYIKRAIAAGKHILSEKPIAPTVTEAVQLLFFQQKATTAKRGGTWSVAENWRFLPVVTQAAEAVKNMGRIKGFRTQQGLSMESGNPLKRKTWRSKATHDQGFHLDGGVHDIASIRQVLGEDIQFDLAMAFEKHLKPDLPEPDTLEAIIRTDADVNGTAQFSYSTAFSGPAFEIACEKGVVHVSGFETLIIEKYQADSKGKDKKTSRKEASLPGFDQSLIDTLDAWANGITSNSNGSKDVRLRPEEALEDLKILESMLQSGKQNGQPVKVHEKRN